ncbi:MAG: Eco57I restriction-modification methylase domain-containing protein [Candidatus Cloacimonetes bacterium]|nr:Eco57I restriction-modification methylase domain-containing protein [Candidatus Cloacimonadota bacterium]
MFNKNLNYNPDVLDALANLSNDEVFTPPKLANQVLDLLPPEIFKNPKTTFLDPGCKSGVFLREIAKRLIKGLKKEIPDLQKRLNHIYTKQLFGITITELTDLLSKRSVYCSKKANGKYSVCRKFKDEKGNIKFNKVNHTWINGRCKYCGASEKVYNRDEILETHAYEFIHTKNPEEIFKMKFDVIIGNPPYQLGTGGGAAQATPLYYKFVQQAKKLNPRYLTMIIPSRWFSGGMGLKQFREEMMNDLRLKKIIDYQNAKECFPSNSIGGGVNYFLWERDYNGSCEITNVIKGEKHTIKRRLDEFPIIVRNNRSVTIINKVKNDSSISSIISPISPFGLPTYTRGKNKGAKSDIKVYSSGGTGYISPKEIKSGQNLITKYKVLLSANTSEHAGEPGKDGTFKVFSTIKILEPNEVCTHSYITLGSFNEFKKAESLRSYLKTKFVRFLVLQTITGISVSKNKFMFVPLQDFSKPWTDEELYKKYDLTKEEIDYIESRIKPMD